MKSNEVRYHNNLSNGKVASVYLEENVFDSPLVCELGAFSHYWFVGAKVGKTRRENNTWWLGKSKRGFNNVSTGVGPSGMLSIARSVELFAMEMLSAYGFVVMSISGTDDRRKEVYKKLFYRFLKRLRGTGTDWVVMETTDGDKYYVLTWR